MKNFVQKGDVLPFIAPAGGVVTGVPVVVGSLVVVPAFSAAATYECEGVVEGVFSFTKKTTDAPAQFAKAYWDSTNKEVTTTATAMTLIGVFTEAYVSGDTACNVRLNGASV